MIRPRWVRWGATIGVLVAGLCVLQRAGVEASWSGHTSSRNEQMTRSSTQASGRPSFYEKGLTAVEAEEYQEAAKFFELAMRKDRKNPDILNMLAYSRRKLGQIDEALELYHKALKRRPRFPEAREYLGEAYLQAALREIDTLRGYGAEGAEALEELIEAFKHAASNLN